ncbi:ABC transporter permease, partial [Celeribacter halophilus]
MTRYLTVLRRLLGAAAVLLLASLVIFLLIEAAPGDPAEIM